MTTSQLYVPILKGKQGEFDALGILDVADAPHVLPLVEVQPIPPASRPTVRNPNRQPREVGAHLTRNLTVPLARKWHTEMIVDLHAVAGMAAVSGTHATTFALDEVRSGGLQVVPMIRVGEPAPHYTAVRAAVRRDGRGIALRITGDDFSGAGVNAAIDALLRAVRLDRQDADLLLDLGRVSAAGPVHAQVITGLTNQISNVVQFRSFTVAAAAFPDSLTAYPSNAVGAIPRLEWLGWAHLHGSPGAVSRVPRFADFGANGPVPGTAAYRGTPNIRYAEAGQWLVFKGAGTDNVGAQHAALAQQLRSHPSYRGANHCGGDAIAHQCTSASPGNPTTWRTVATAHHITQTVRQIAPLYGAAAGGPP